MNMFLKLLFWFLFIANAMSYCKTFKLYENLPTNTFGTRNISMDVIGRWLAKPLLNIQHLHLNLRSKNYQQDASNSYTQWFFKQTLVPITTSDYELTVTINKTAENFKHNNNVIVTSMMDLRSTARQFERKAATYFFIANGEIDFKELRDIFHSYWKRSYIFQNFLLNENGVFIYDPFALDKSGNYGNVIRYIGEETIEKTIFYNMRGYPLRVQIFKSIYARPIVTKDSIHVEGVDGKVANVLQKQMNFTMNLQHPDPHYFGERSRNGTYNGAIGSIVKNEIDLCLTGFFIKDYMVPEMEFSVAVYDDKLCIFTPKATRLPQSILPIFAVRYDLWLGFISMAFVSSLFWAFLRAFNLYFNIIKIRGRRLDKKFKSQYVRILIDTWVVWLRVTITRYPPFNSERVFVVSLCLISVIFGSIFESSLATVYIHPLYYKDIHTLQDLDDKGLYIMYKYLAMGDDLFFSETSPLFASLNKKLRFVNDLHAEIIDNVANTRQNAGVTRYSNIRLQSLHLIISEKIWVVPECPKYYSISYVWPKGAPWEETINQILLRMLNGGLINKFIAEMQNQVDIKCMKNIVYQKQQSLKTLTIEDLQLSFYVILTGSLIAFLSLLVERKRMLLKN